MIPENNLNRYWFGSSNIGLGHYFGPLEMEFGVSSRRLRSIAGAAGRPVFPFNRAHEAFTLFADRTDGVIKVVLTAKG